MTTTVARQSRRSATEWDEFAKEIIPELRNGRKLSDYADQIGSNVDAVRTALARQGVDSHGSPLELKPVGARSPKVLARRVAKRREQGAPWWMLQAETGKSYGELRRLLTEHGLWGDVSGRIRNSRSAARNGR